MEEKQRLKTTNYSIMEITEGNKLIAEFLGGYKTEGIEGWNFTNVKDFIVTGTDDESLSFNVSWDWLMPVCKKVSDYGYDVNINSGLRRINIMTNDWGFVNGNPHYHEEFRGNSSFNKGLSDIECVWLAIVDFIRWHNSLNPASVNTINK